MTGEASKPRRASWSTGGGRSGVAARLVLIIAVCVLPAIGIYVAIGWMLWEDRKAQLEDLVLQQAQLLAGNVSGISGGAQILLAAAEEFRQVRSFGDECNARLTALDRKAPGFLFLIYIDPEGTVRCASNSR